ncbi:unnamed protein product [Adineta steineri]|uniref:Uncharacterized protein n=1 Tax=Adineta steineri TaxID=433720 RepID=A0A814VKM7_9BILA|nr:unnamed protein product [Adineta steineri]CAF1247131.1 unnamed protein product [Adineta steineri]CAF1300333.1 unnamed protein product [Adineta steineri]CAF3555303.1 unnamed protein product [Adineta steineri]CAF3617154.1 unnamed protein product [Adineta steineri]
MLNNQSDIQLFPIYKLFFDDIEEIFLNTISFRILIILILITCFFIIGIIILLFNRSTNTFSSHLNPFIYALIFYDFIQLLSLITLKYNFTEQFFNQLCRWPYYLKSSSESGQCITLIFLFALSRHQIRYFLAHNHLPKTNRINSRALTFVCLLFIVYDNNWITHVKIEKIHLITLNETKYEINIRESHIPLYENSNKTIHSHLRFITDLDRYSQGQEKNLTIQNQHKTSTDEIIHNNRDGSIHEIIFKIPYDVFNPTTNRTKRKLTRYKREQTISENKNNSSYQINRCTYGQRNFFLSNFLLLIHSIIYFILILYYLIIVYSYKIENINIDYHQQLSIKSLKMGRRKSAERHEQFILLIHLKRFLYLITYSHTLLTFIRLVYICLLTILLCLLQTPFKWLPIKIIFYSLFLIIYFSIPIRMSLLFIYLFLNHFSTQIESIFFYIFHTKLRFSWKLEKPTICFRLQFIPYTNNSNQIEGLTNSLIIDLSSTMEEDQSTMFPNDSAIVYDESSSGYNPVTTTMLVTPLNLANETTSNISVIAKL